MLKSTVNNMSMVHSRKEKHLISRITIDDIAFYYSKGCMIMPNLRSFYIDQLTLLEVQGKICFTPEALLERYHLNLKKRSNQPQKYIQNKS